MPANLFVVIFPRKVKAHPIYVTRKEPKEKPKRQWSVGGLRSPPGVFPAREGRGGRGDKKQSTTSQLPRQFANIAMSSSSTSGSGFSSNDRFAIGSSAHNELKNQRTVRIQLSRPTDEVEPTQKLTDLVANGMIVGLPNHDNLAAGVSGAGAGVLESSTIGNRRRSHSWNYADNQLASNRRHSLIGTAADVGAPVSGVGPKGSGGTNSGVGYATAMAGGLARDLRSTSASVPTARERGSSVRGGGASSLLEMFTSDPGYSGRTEGTGQAAPPPVESVALALSKDDVQDLTTQPQEPPVAISITGSNNWDANGRDSRHQSQAQLHGIETQSQSEQRTADDVLADKGRIANAGVSGAVLGEEPGGSGVGTGGAGSGPPRWDESKDEDLRSSMQSPVDEAGKKNLEVIEVIGDDGVDVPKPGDIDEAARVDQDIEHYVRSVLQDIRSHNVLIGEPTYHLSAGGQLMTCIFPCDGEDSHLVLTKLESVGVGSEVGSVNVLPMEIGRSDITRRKQREMNERDQARANRRKRGRFGLPLSRPPRNTKSNAASAADGMAGEGRSAHTSNARIRRGGNSSAVLNPMSRKSSDEKELESTRAYAKFRALASQIRVAQVTEEIREGTKFHFDYLALLIASSTISAMGLATDNVAIVVAAMLVSPIMGPVLAFTFGTNVRDWSLAKQGFAVECLSLVICVVVGFVVGLVGVFCVEEDYWPTHEMGSRGEYWGLLTGLVIAIPSGMAVALSTLSKNVNSLVGVAISASLLPPAVNTGLCLSIAILGFFIDSINMEEPETKYVQIGLISMCLTIVNILGIYVSGVCLFLFKEVAPIKSENSFWSKDMIEARKFQSMLGKYGGEGGEAANNLRKRLYEEVRWPWAARETEGGGKLSGKEAFWNLEPKGSFSSSTNTHHRYRHKDRRRRTTVFELFGDSFLAGDDSEPALEADVPPDLGQEQASQSRPESAGFMGLVANRIRSARPFGRSEDSTPSEELRE